MSRYWPELALGAVLLALLLGVCHWQAPGTRLSAAEVEAYIRILDEQSALPATEKAALFPRLRAWGLADDGRPLHMLNLMRYHETLQPWPGVHIDATSPQAANRHYEQVATRIALPAGPSMAFAGEPQGTGSAPSPSTNLFGTEPAVDNWSRILIVRYPSRRTFFELITDPEYLPVMPYKFAALQVALTPLTAKTITPDLRLLTGLVGLIVLLGFGWLRAARRG